MCNKQPGLRCAKHASRAAKTAYKTFKDKQKIYDKTPTMENWVVAMEARQNRKLALDLYYASTTMMNLLSTTSANYDRYAHLNKTLKGMGKAGSNTNNNTPLTIGNKVDTTNGLTKNITSNDFIVNTNKKQTVTWNPEKPGTFSIYNNKLEKVNEVNAHTINYYNSKPDLRWAVWVATQTRFR